MIDGTVAIDKMSLMFTTLHSPYILPLLSSLLPFPSLSFLLFCSPLLLSPLLPLPPLPLLPIAYRNGKLYWADIRQKAIFRSNLNGSNVEVVVDGSLQSPDGIAVDWVSQKVYWTDSTKGTIEVASTNGEDQKVLIWENLDKPRAIVVDPIRRYVRTVHTYPCT